MSVRARAAAALALSEAGGRVYDRMGFLIEPGDVPVYTHALAELEHRERLFAAKWTTFVTRHIDSTERTFPDRDTLLAMPEFRSLVFKGIPDKYRPKVCCVHSPHTPPFCFFFFSLTLFSCLTSAHTQQSSG